MDTNEGELEKRAEDIKAIRELLTQGNDIPLIYPWAFFAWALLVGIGSIAHYELYLTASMGVKAALVWIWLPILILGSVAESLSFAFRASKQALPLFNRRLGGAILSCIASMVVFTVIVIRLAMVAITPGIAVLLAAMPIVFYAQVCLRLAVYRDFRRNRHRLALRVRGRRRSCFLFGRRDGRDGPVRDRWDTRHDDREAAAWLIPSRASTVFSSRSRAWR